MSTQNAGAETAQDGPLFDLQAYLRHQLGNKVRDLQVVVTPAGIHLKGWATSYHAKQMAQETVLKWTPLPLVANEIQVV